MTHTDSDDRALDDRAPRDPTHRVDRRATWYWLLSTLLTGIPLAALLFTGGLIWSGLRPWFWIPAAAGLALTLVTGAIMPFLRYRVHRWEATDTAVYVRTGWLSREWKAAPLSRVQTVESTRNPLHRLFGLASVSITTASSAGAVLIDGLAAERAATLALHLTAVTERTEGDAT